MSKEMTIKIGDSLREDVIIEILSWLPVKTLLRFKRVCKSWYAIITSSYFISKHLKNYYNNNGYDKFLAQYFISPAGEIAVYKFSQDETSRVLSYEELHLRPIYNAFICGPCNGIFYLDHYYYRHHRALWNPATKELKTLPPLISKPNHPSPTGYQDDDYFGFGFDEVTKDFKAVVIKYCYYKSGEMINDPSSVFVYSLSTDSWRYCGDLAIYRLFNNKCYICLNGVFYWLGDKTYPSVEVIVSFDMASELCQVIQVPDYEEEQSYEKRTLAVYRDSLAFLSVHFIKKCLEIWTLNEGCWTRKFTIQFNISGELGSPIGHWKNDKFILETIRSRAQGSRLILCDPITQEISDLEGVNYSCQGIFVYRESLVSLKNRNEREEHREADALKAWYEIDSDLDY